MIQSLAPELTSDPRLWFSGMIDVAMIVATIIVAVLFFKKRRVAVRAIIGLMVASIFANFVQSLLSAAIFEEIDYDTVKDVIHACVFGAVWIPYFLKSERVKNTFVDGAFSKSIRSSLWNILRRCTVIKISFWICGTCLIVWSIFVGIICITESPPSSKDWEGIFIITAGLAIGSFSLSFLGGHIIKGNKGAIRLGVLISALWVMASFVVSQSPNWHVSWAEFFGIGFIPVISYLGILWVISGFLPKKSKTEDQ